MNQTMKLPQREFYTLHEVAARWGCALADIAGWSTAGKFDVITGTLPAGTRWIQFQIILTDGILASNFTFGLASANASITSGR